MSYRLERFFYYLLLATIPIQLGKHFWPNFSFVQGIRVDYLSPTLYLSDVFIILLLLFYLYRKKGKSPFIKNKLFLSGLLIILLGFFSAFSKEAVLLGSMKYMELVFVGYYVANEVGWRDLGKTLFIFSLGSGVQVILSLFQLLSQSSLGGVFYFLGERTFSRTTPGIALFSFNDSLWLRPYGSFPHPNVLGFYFFTNFFLLLSFLFYQKDKFLRIIILLTLIFLALGVTLTFSRLLIILLLILTPVYLLLQYRRHLKKIIGLGLITFGFVLIFLFSRFTQTIERDIIFRVDLIKIALNLFQNSPLFGVGLNNFYYHEIIFQKTISPTLLQPVHNIYLLILSQTGIIGLGLVGYFIKNLLIALRMRLKESFYNGVAMLVVSVLVIGLFDHFLLTLQQGQLLLAIVIGFSFSKIKALG